MANVARLLLYVGVMLAIGDVCAQWARAAHWTSRIPADEQRRPVLAWLAIMTAALLLFIAQFLALELAPTATNEWRRAMSKARCLPQVTNAPD